MSPPSSVRSYGRNAVRAGRSAVAAESLLAGVFSIYQRYQSIGGDQLTMQVRLLASIASLICHPFDPGECCAMGGDGSVESDFEC